MNDGLGHHIGDQLLVGIARRLEQCLRPADTVARLGGDEFTILLDDLKDVDDATKLAERVQAELTLPFSFAGQRRLHLGQHRHRRRRPRGYHRHEDLLRDADIAMYRAKALGKARYEMFDRAMHLHAVSRLQLETDFRRAVERNEISIHYQPIVSPGHRRGRRLRGPRALGAPAAGHHPARRVHPAGGGDRPDPFPRALPAARGLPPGRAAPGHPPDRQREPLRPPAHRRRPAGGPSTPRCRRPGSPRTG